MLSRNSIAFLFFVGLTLQNCQDPLPLVPTDFVYTSPDYNQLNLNIGTDTLSFEFKDTTFHKIKSLNTFIQDSTEYIAFFENKYQRLLIYALASQNFITQIPVRRFIDNSRPFFTAAYIKNFDSVFVFDDHSVQIFDTAGHQLNSIGFIKDTLPEILFYTTGNPPIFLGTKLYTSTKPPLRKNSLAKLKKERIMYEFDLQHGSSNLHYGLPEIYFTKYLGYPYLGRSHCHNNKNFVFSFAADSNIYETDLSGLQVAHNAKSQFQTDNIRPMDSEKTVDEVEGKKNYLTNDAYGAIYYDHSRKRYLRTFLRKISDKNYEARQRDREQTLIVFDKEFTIVGETKINNNVQLDRLFIANNGAIYAQLNDNKKNTIRFVELEYQEKSHQIGKRHN